jgi:hypothetical protein
MADVVLERSVIQAVAHEGLRERLLYFVGKPKRRPSLLDAIHTSEFLAPAACLALPSVCTSGSRESGVKVLGEHLARLGAGDDCYAISLLSTLDGRTLPLTDALDGCFMNTVETLLFDPAAGVGYFEGGHPNDRFIVRTTRAAL